MTAKSTQLLLVSVTLGVLCLTHGAFARGGGGGGGHGGGGHFGGGGGHFGGGGGHFGGGAHFGGGPPLGGVAHFGGGPHLGGAHLGGGGFGGTHLGGAGIGAAHIGHLGGAGLLGHAGDARSGHIGDVGLARNHLDGDAGARFHGLERFNRNGFNRNAFGGSLDWDRWGGRHWGAGWNRWGAGWGGWAGPVFWPYLYGDVFSYLLWPDDYYDPFWSYGPDYLLSSIFWPGPYYSEELDGEYDGLYDVYGDDTSSDSGSFNSGTGQPATNSTSGITVTCAGLAPGVTDVPIERIRQAVHPTGDQIHALDDLKSAVSKASNVVKMSCPNRIPLTPPDRLDAVQKRLEATAQAVQIVRASFESFYDSLSDAQKKRLSAIGAPASGRSSADVGVTALCDPRAASFTQLPVQRIEQAIRPTQQQEAAFDAMKTASANAASALQASCPAEVPETPVDRIDAVEKRLDAMVQAAKSVRPALDAFYATLNDEQKARFNISGFSANAATQ